MKDNEKNLSNEATESVAGGKINTWNRGNRKQFMYKLLPDSAEDTMSKYNPHQFFSLIVKSRRYTKNEIAEIKKGLEIK